MWAEKLYRFRWISLACILLVAGLASFRLSALDTEVTLREFFPERDSDYRFFEDVREALGHHDELIRVAIPGDSGIYRRDFLERLRTLTEQLDSLSRVSKATSIATLEKPIGTPLGIQWVPYVRLLDDEARIDRVRIAEDRSFTQPYLDQQESVVTVLVEPESGLSHQEVERLLDQVEHACARLFPEKCYLGGVPHLEVNYARMSRQSLRAITGYSLVFLVLVLVILFRSPIGVLYPLAVVLLSWLVFVGYLATIGRPLGIMASLFPTLVLVVGLSDVIHLLSRYDATLKTCDRAQAAIPGVLAEIAPILLLTSLTTALGLLTFLESDMVALSQFGLDAAVAVLITFVVTMLTAPAVLACHSGPRPVLRTGISQSLAKLSEFISSVSTMRPKIVFPVAILITILSVAGITRISTNSSLQFRFSGNPGLKEDIEFFEGRLGGIRRMQLAVVPAQGEVINSLAVLNEVGKLHRLLVEDPLFTDVVSPLTFYQGLHRVWRPYTPEGLELPRTDGALRSYELRASSLEGAMPRRLVDANRKLGLVAAAMPDVGRNDAARIMGETFRWIDTHVDTSLVGFRRTGMSYMVDQGHQHRVDNMFFGLTIALVSIAVLVGIMLRDVRMLFIALLVNLLPLVWAGGLMGWLGIELRGATSMVFAVGFVIAVDDTLHFLSPYSSSLRRGVSPAVAVRGAIGKTARGIVATSLALLGAFIVLVTSSFWEIKVFGGMVGFLLAGALLADLFVLPALLRFLAPRISSQNEGMVT